MMAETNPSILKEGYLVKKGHHRKSWKTRWFVLQEDRLRYYRQKDRTFSVGLIKLNGCSLLFPVPDYVKRRKDVFKLTTPDGREYLFQASNEDEREGWLHAVSAVIRSQDSTLQCCYVAKCGSQQLHSPCDLSDMLGAMQDIDAGVAMTTMTLDDIEYKNCFSGSDAVDWLIRWSFAQTRDQAKELTSVLLQLAHIQPMGTGPTQNTTHKDSLIDADDAYYRFTTLKRSPSHELLFDSSSDSSSSVGEESEGDVLGDHGNSAMGKGKVIKDGFLMKRGHLRKKWKLRKVIVRENPPILEYYSAVKDSKDMLKMISLEGAVAVGLQDDNKNEIEMSFGCRV